MADFTTFDLKTLESEFGEDKDILQEIYETYLDETPKRMEICISSD